MKIGIVFDDSLDRPDGVQQYIKTIGRWFMSQGHHVHYLVGQSNPELNSDLKIHSLARNFGVKGNQNSLSLPLPVKREVIRNILDKENFDVLHVQMPYNPLMGGRVISEAPKETKIVGTFHIVGASKMINVGSKILGLAQRSTLKHFDEIVAVSTAAQDYARDHFRIESVVIPNAVDVSKFHKGKKMKKYSDGLQNIVFMNRLEKRKGCKYLIEAIHWLDNRGKFDNRRAIICGKGPLRAELELTAKRYGLSEKIVFEGFVPEETKQDYLATADLAVYPSTGGESFGIVLIEAMSSGALTLGGNNVGYATVLGGQPELLVDPTDTEEFASRIDSLLSSPKEAKQLVEWQSKEVKKYDVAEVGRQLIYLYKN